MPFFVRQKMQILLKILPKILNFAIFRHPKIRPLAAVNLLYEVFSKTVSRLLASTFLFVCQKMKTFF